jgi:acyl-CoA thioester hydrolase
MLTHRTLYRVIYADIDKMGFGYHANYFRWFETARAEMFRFIGLPYKEIEARGYFLPVSELHCKFINPVQYDDLLIIETSLDTSIRAGIKFDYTAFDENGDRPMARAYTRHAFMDSTGKVVRPPDFLTQLIHKHSVFTG